MSGGRGGAGFRINAVDRLGREIDVAVRAAAEQIGQRAVEYGERLLRDSAMATDLLEEAAATVSRAIKVRGNAGSSRIRNLEGYVFRAFVRHVVKARRKDFSLTCSGGEGPKANDAAIDLSREFDQRILVGELLGRLDPVTRDMFYRRIQGFSWKEIARAHGISRHAAESKFSQALWRVRKKLGLIR